MREAGLLEQLAGELQVRLTQLQGGVVTPGERRQQAGGRLSGLEVDSMQQVLHVDGAGQRLAHLHLVEGGLAGIECQEGDVHARLDRQVEIRILVDHRQLAGGGGAHHVALAGQQLGEPLGRLGRDVVDQLFNLGLAAPVAGMAQVTDELVVTVLLEAEGPGAYGAIVEQRRGAGLDHLLAILGRQHHGVVACQGGEEGGIRSVELEHHLIGALLVDPLDEGGQPQAVEIGVLAAGDGVERVVFVQQALVGEQHVVGVELAGRAEPGGAMEGHPLAQVQGIGEPIVAAVPVSGQAPLDAQGIGVHLEQAIIERAGTGIQGHPRIGDLRVEGLGSPFDTVDEPCLGGLCLFLTAGDQDQETEQQWFEHSHYGTMFSCRVARRGAGALQEPAGQGLPLLGSVAIAVTIQPRACAQHAPKSVMAQDQSLSALPLLSSPSSSWYLRSMPRNW
ncbi:hypothetical protein D3C84_599670 [compost metagenome]